MHINIKRKNVYNNLLVHTYASPAESNDQRYDPAKSVRVTMGIK